MALSSGSKILVSDVKDAIKSITRSGTTFTYTTLSGSTGTFTQQDNNTTYSAGTGISISGTTISNTGVTSVNGSTGAVTISTGGGTATAVSGYGVSSNNYNYTLPSGGSYAYFRRYWGYDSSTGGNAALFSAGTASGGTQFAPGGGLQSILAIRIA